MISNRFDFRVIYADTDMMGRVYYGKYLEYFEAARSHMLREINLPYSELEKMGVFLPVIEAHCEYKGAATFEDNLIIHTSIYQFPKAKIRIDYKVFKDGNEAVIAKGYTIHSFIKKTGQPIRPPKIFLDALKNHWVEE